MTKLEMVQSAWLALGEAPADALAAFVRDKYGVTIDPKFIPIFKASLRDKERLAAARQAARALSEPIPVPAPVGSSPLPAFALSAGPERLDEIQRFTLQLLAVYGLGDWSFAFNRRKRAMGMCFYGRKTIELSTHFAERNQPAEILDTILHEIAHALVGPSHGHDEVWKRKCLEIGARPQRCGQADMPEGRWKAHCPSCGNSFHRHRKPKRLKNWFCRTCGPEQGKLVWQEEDAAEHV